MAKIKGAIVVDTERCKGCNLCVVACPLNVIALTKEVNVKGYNYAHQILEDTCNGCSSCATVSCDLCLYFIRVLPAERGQREGKGIPDCFCYGGYENRCP